MRKREPQFLGFHGLVFRCPDPAKLADRFRALTGMPVLRRSAREVVLGSGPELFLTFRKGADRASEEIMEAHLAVKRLAEGRKGEADALGGDSWQRDAGPVRLILREFFAGRHPRGGENAENLRPIRRALRPRRRAGPGASPCPLRCSRSCEGPP